MNGEGSGDVIYVTGDGCVGPDDVLDGTGAGSYHTSPSSGGICASDKLGPGDGVSVPHAAGSNPAKASRICSQVNITSVRPAARHKQHLATVPRMVAAAVKKKVHVCLRLGFQRPLHMAKAKLEKWEQSRERCPTVQLLVRRQLVRLVANPRRHDDGVTRVHARFRTWRPCRRQRHAAEQAGSLQAGHRGL